MANSFWKNCLKKFSQEFDHVTFNAFIEPLKTYVEDDTFYIVSSNAAVDKWLKTNLENSLNVSFKEAGLSQKYVFKTDSSLQPTFTASTFVEKTDKPRTSSIIGPVFETGLNKNNTFDSFISGQTNELALMAAKKIAQGGSDNISPLFIYGGTGLGKTHLVHAIGNTYLKTFPSRKVFYTPARTFLKDFVTACRLNRIEQFKDHYHGLDMLIIDDIQYIGGDKERTQEEFFYLFNILQEGNKDIVITCDRPPTQIRNMNSRLTSRFNSGLATHIPTPEYELRVEIVRYRSNQWKTPFDDEVIYFVAEHIRSNVRELQGAIKRIIALSAFKGLPPSLTICKQALSDFIGKNNVTISADAIKEKVSLYYNIRINDLSSKKRNHSITLPRHVCIYLCRQLTNMSLPEIGKVFNRNHTTVLYSCRTIEDKVKKDKDFLDQVRHLEMAIKEQA